MIKRTGKVNDAVSVAMATKSTDASGKFKIAINDIKEEKLVKTLSLSQN